MIGPLEKGFAAAKLETPPKEVYEGVALSVLPKYICYRAALLKEKMTLQYVVVALLLLTIGHYATSRFETLGLYQKLREKEYILAPGVLDFTPASPQTVTDAYINDAVTDFLSDLGNVNGASIDEQYARLTRFMSKKLRIQFEMDTLQWVAQVKAENISQMLTVREREIRSDDKGNYKVVALGRAEFYGNQNYLGYEDQVIEMTLRLVPPEMGKRWTLQLETLAWNKESSFNTRKDLSKPDPQEPLAQ
ncbi:MAG: hypothetical protein AB7T49_06670 [Oligoflexales bacterium]